MILAVSGSSPYCNWAEAMTPSAIFLICSAACGESASSSAALNDTFRVAVVLLVLALALAAWGLWYERRRASRHKPADGTRLGD